MCLFLETNGEAFYSPSPPPPQLFTAEDLLFAYVNKPFNSEPCGTHPGPICYFADVGVIRQEVNGIRRLMSQSGVTDTRTLRAAV